MKNFRVSKERYVCQCLASLSHAHMLMHVIAHEGCTDAVRESSLKVDSGRKIPAAPGNQTCISGMPFRRCGSWATSLPCLCVLFWQENQANYLLLWVRIKSMLELLASGCKQLRKHPNCHGKIVSNFSIASQKAKTLLTCVMAHDIG